MKNAQNLGRSDDAKRRKKRGWPKNHRSRDKAVLGVVNATENKQKSPKGDSHICRPSEEDTPNFVPFCEELKVELPTKLH